MPHWSNSPPSRGDTPALPVRRTPPDRPLLAIVLSDDLLGCPTHYWGGRTLPCEAPDCPACHASHPWRWHGYLAAIEPNTPWPFLFEITAAPADAFLHYRTLNQTLRACLFEARRLKPKANSRVIIRCKPSGQSPDTLPPAPDLLACLSTLWDLPLTALTDDRILKGHPRVTPNQPEPTGNNQ